jgi:hypothetical protein
MTAAGTDFRRSYRGYSVHLQFDPDAGEPETGGWCARIPGLGETICEPTFDLAFAKSRGYIDCLSRKVHPSLQGSRENPLSTRAAWTVGLLAAAGVVVGGIAFVSSRKAATASTPATPPVRVPPKYITGHRYRVRITGAPVAQISPALVTVANAQAKIDQQAPGLVKVFSATLTGTTLSVTVDYIAATQDSKAVSKELIDQLAARGLTIANVTVTIADEGIQVVGGTSNATDRDALWYAWKQDDNDPNDSGTNVYVGPREDYAATAAAYYSTLGFRTGYYLANP